MTIPTTKVSQRPEKNPRKAEQQQLEKKENFMRLKGGGSLEKVLRGTSADEA